MKWLWDIIVAGLRAFFAQISPTLREKLYDVVKQLEEVAKTTPTDADNILVENLKEILGIKE